MRDASPVPAALIVRATPRSRVAVPVATADSAITIILMAVRSATPTAEAAKAFPACLDALATCDAAALIARVKVRNADRVATPVEETDRLRVICRIRAATPEEVTDRLRLSDRDHTRADTATATRATRRDRVRLIAATTAPAVADRIRPTERTRAATAVETDERIRPTERTRAATAVEALANNFAGLFRSETALEAVAVRVFAVVEGDAMSVAKTPVKNVRDFLPDMTRSALCC